MARPKAFDRNQALDKAMRLFWQKGYKATSIEELCQHMGINRGSLYATFGSKHALFLEAIERYKEFNGIQVGIDEQASSGIAAIETIFSDVIDNSVHDENPSGCLISNTIAEFAPHNTEIAAICIDNRKEYEAVFHNLLTHAEQRDEISHGKDLTVLAQFLVNTLFGLHITSKTTNDRKILESIVNAALSALT